MANGAGTSSKGHNAASADDYGVVYFDGVCNLCNGCVDFLIRRDKVRRLRYASLQSPHGQEMVRRLGFENGDVESIILVDRGERYVRSSAVLRMVSGLGGIYRLVSVFYVVPRPLRDLVYRWVAKNRYRMFGKRDTCRVPTPEEHDLFVEE